MKDKLLKRFVATELPQKLDYRLRDGIEAEHRKADFGSWKQAQQKARVFGESEPSPVASSARRGFPYSETRICQSAQRPYSRTRCVSHEACLAGSISSRFTSQKRWPERAFIFRKGNENAGDVEPRSDVSPEHPNRHSSRRPMFSAKPKGSEPSLRQLCWPVVTGG